jgi:hypothetical protein
MPGAVALSRWIYTTKRRSPGWNSPERFRESPPTPGNTAPTAFAEDKQLRAVRKAISTFLPEISEISVKRNPLRMEVTKNGEKYRVDQLSDGEKCLLALVGEARLHSERMH